MATHARNVLVVDDEPLVLAAYRRSLQRHWNVVTATDIASAKRCISEVKPELAIVDMWLGAASGLELIQAIKAERPDAKVAIISGYMSIDAAVTATKLGADAAVAKPVAPSDVLARLANGMPVANDEPPVSLARAEYELIARTMADSNHNVSRAARRLGIHRHTLQRKLKRVPPKS